MDAIVEEVVSTEDLKVCLTSFGVFDKYQRIGKSTVQTFLMYLLNEHMCSM